MAEKDRSQQELIAGLRKGDPNAQGQLLTLYGEPLVRFLMVVCRISQDEAEDCAVEALYRAIERIDTFGEGRMSSSRSFRNWLFTIGRNLWRDHVRREPQIANTPLDNLLVPTDRQSGIDADTISPPLQAVREALTKLPDSQRLTLTLHYGGLQLKEVAEVLGVEQETVRQWKRRGLVALTKILSNHPALSHLTGSDAQAGGGNV